jgi:D-serine deaminase-like pyridoxal phosphate-dependent protein
LTLARHAVSESLSPEAMVDAARMASNFERMVHIADSTGIP